MNQIPRIVERVCNSPWLITSEAYASVRMVLDSKLAGTNLGVESRNFNGTDMDAPVDRNAIGQLFISGVTGQRLNMIEKVCGGVDYADIPSVVNEALDSGAKGLLMHFDSPGGAAIGCQEAAEFIASIEVPTVAFCDSQMCSAAYFMASGCNSIVATESAVVGSIGAIMPWVDQSRMYSMAGLSSEPIVSEGDDLKAAGYGPSLTPAQREHLQTAVNRLATSFKGHVSKYRTLDYATLRAGAYSGQTALEYNLVDAIGGYPQAYEKLMSLIAKR